MYFKMQSENWEEMKKKYMKIHATKIINYD